MNKQIIFSEPHGDYTEVVMVYGSRENHYCHMVILTENKRSVEAAFHSASKPNEFEDIYYLFHEDVDK